MKTTEFTRAQFLGWLGEHSGEKPFSLPLDSVGGRREVTLVWPEEADDESPIIAVDAEEIRDFLAFVSTYVGTYVPFTAFFRVVPRQMIDSLPWSRPDSRQESLEAFLGVVICDAALQIGGTPPRAADISLQACLATPSAAVASAALLGYDSGLSKIALRRWFSVREELTGGNLRVQPEQLMFFWSSALTALLPRNDLPDVGENQLIVEFVSAVRHGAGVASEHDWKKIGRLIPDVQNFASALRSNREDRVRVLDQFVSTLRHSSSSMANGMMLGYLAAQVAEGSLNYVPLAYRSAEQFPLALLWFGLFSGLNRNNDIMTAGECLGRRVARRLKPDRGFGPVRADLSYEEFTLFLQEARIGKVRTDYQSVMEIELIPGVSGRYRLVRNGRKTEDLTSRLDNVRKIVSQLQAALREAETETKPEIDQLFDDSGQRTSPKQRTISTRRKPYSKPYK